MKHNLGIGFMRFNPNDSYNNQLYIDYCMNHGINYFETCYFYLNGKCEEYVYELLKKYPRHTYKICGKLPVQHAFQAFKKDFKTIYFEQLNKVPGQYFDYYLIQSINPIVIYEIISNDIISFLLQEKEKGHIKNLGISLQCSPEYTKQILMLKYWDIVQMPLNLFDWYFNNAKENYMLCKEAGIPIIGQSPLKGGFLNNYLQESLGFIDGLDNIEYLLFGTTSLKHIQDINNSYYESPSIDFIEKIIYNYKQSNTIKCFLCNKCYDICPKHIPLALFFKSYNEALNGKNYKNFIDLKILYEEPMDICIFCKKCEDVCPLHLPITDYIKNQLFRMRA